MKGSTEKLEELALYVVATPIGNLQDLSNRAARVLSTVDLIAAEDTRHTRQLLTHLGSRARLISAHTHNERSSAATVIQSLTEGQSCALVSDAGTPAVSDPGARLVNAVRQAGFPVIPVPGASAATALLSAAGIDADRFGPAADRFLFAGFLPSRSNARLEALRQLHKVPATIVLLESARRIEALVMAIEQVFGGQRTIVLGREISKKFEQIVSMNTTQLLEWLSADVNRRRGEIILAIAPPARQDDSPPPADHINAETSIELSLDAGELMSVLSEFLAPSKAARLAKRLSGLPQDALYALAVDQSSGHKSAKSN